MALEDPLESPDALKIKMIKNFNLGFSGIFAVEMAMKLIALGVFWGPGTYLRSGWNWLDGGVVFVSLMDIVAGSSAGPLKTLRILRAFRPLRVISRNENLKLVVNTIF